MALVAASMVGIAACQAEGDAGEGCRTPRPVLLPAASAGWGPVDEAYFASHDLCKQRSYFDLAAVRSRAELDAVKQVVRPALTVANARTHADLDSQRLIRPLPVTAQGWQALLEPGRLLPPTYPGASGWRGQLRPYLQGIRVVHVVPGQRVCLAIGYSRTGRSPAALVQVHRFARGDDGQWRFDGFEPDGACLGEPGGGRG